MLELEGLDRQAPSVGLSRGGYLAQHALLDQLPALQALVSLVIFVINMIIYIYMIIYDICVKMIKGILI